LDLRCKDPVKVKVEHGKIVQIEFTLLAGDVKEDCKVNILDLISIAKVFGNKVQVGSAGDIDGNGKIDIVDLVLTAKNFGKTCTDILFTICEPGKT
jgi:hypothetical protein